MTRTRTRTRTRTSCLRRSLFTLALTGVSLASMASLGCTRAGAGPSDPGAQADAPRPHGGDVEFLAWEPASFERAAAEDKLILINVIATWCHWCHVMDEETFADPEVAALLAEHFVVIRVDSDARPDVSERYKAWGWPATAFLSPNAQPALNLRGYRAPAVFAPLLRELVAEHQAGTLRRLDPQSQPGDDSGSEPRTDRDLEPIRAEARAQLDGYWDPEGLGWGGKQKYPWPEPIEYAFLRTRVHADPDWQARALATLEAERALIDPVDGGMYQYSLRGVWDRPHFERITMVQAGAIETYAHAAMITGDRSWLDPALAVAGYMRDHMQAPAGGFYTSQDADLRRADGTAVPGVEYFAKDEPGRNALGTPRIDTAVYADLNGLMIHALTELYRATGDARVLADAQAAGDRLLATHRRSGGGFDHAAHEPGRPTPSPSAPPLAYLSDQVAVGWALLGLHRTTGDSKWLVAARELAEWMELELAAEHGGYFAHTRDPAAVGVFAERRVPLPDNALAAQFLIELHQLVDGADPAAAAPLLDRARASLVAVGNPAELESRGKIVGRYLIAVELYLATRFDITIVAAPGDPNGDALWRAALSHWEPRAAIERSEPGQRYPDIGKPAAYLCSDQACSRPVTAPDSLAAAATAFVGPPARD